MIFSAAVFSEKVICWQKLNSFALTFYAAVKYCTLLLFIAITSNLLISTNAFASNQQADIVISFHQQLELIKQLKKAKPEQALKQLNSHGKSIDKLPLTEQVAFYQLKSEILCDLSDFQACQQTAEHGLTTARKMNSPSELMSELFYQVGNAVESLGNITAAENYYLQGLEFARSLEQSEQIAYGLINLGAIYYQTHKEDLALVALHDALNLALQVKDPELTGYIYAELGILYGNLGDQEQSREYYKKSYDTYLAAGNYIYAYNNARNLGINYANASDYEKSIQAYKDIIDNQEKIANDELIFSAYMGIAKGLVNDDEEENDQSAYDYVIKAEPFLINAQMHSLPLRYLTDKALIFDKLKRYDEAIEALDKAENMFNYDGSSYSAIQLLQIKGLKAGIYYDLGHFETAYTLLQDFLMIQQEYQQARHQKKVVEIQMQYDAAKAELANELLTSQAELDKITLANAQQQADDNRRNLLLLAIVALIFGWVLFRIFNNQKKLVAATELDSITGAFNRQYILSKGRIHLTDANDASQSYSVLIIDCDNFNQINHQFGYHFGDHLLSELPKLFLPHLPTSAELGRLADDQFILLLRTSDIEQNIAIAEKLKQAVESADIVSQLTAELGLTAIRNKQEANGNESLYNEQCNHKLTVSIGIKRKPENDNADFDQLVTAAIAKCYQAKQMGKNKVCV